MTASSSPESASDPLLGQVLGDRYQVIAALGTGGMANVYLGEHRLLRKKVAIKVLRSEVGLDAEAAARFETEAVAAARLDHPNCVGISDFGRTPWGQYYLVMELIDGQPVSDLLRGNQRMAWTRAVPIVRQVLRGLARAHELGIVHRDLKPSNIMLTSKPGASDLVKIIDFGIAKLFGSAAEVAPQVETSADIVFGTADYMPPERLRGERTIDERSDLYAVGVSLYEMVAGRRPFVAAEAYAVAKLALTTPAQPPSKVAPEAGIPAALESAILRALEKDPARRFASARDFLAALEAPDLAIMAPDLPRMASTAVGPSVPTTALPRSSRRTALLVASAVGLVALIVVGVTCAAQRGPGPAPAEAAVAPPSDALAAEVTRLAGEARDPDSLERRQRAADRLIALGKDDDIPLAAKLALDLGQADTCEDRLVALTGLEKLKDPASLAAVHSAAVRPDNECLRERAERLEAELTPPAPGADPQVVKPKPTRPKSTRPKKAPVKPKAPAKPAQPSGGGHFGHL